MRTQHARTLTGDSLGEEPSTRPNLRVVRHAPPRRSLRVFAAATAALVATGGYVHLCLYRHGYRTIPKIGVGFLLQVVASAVIAGALLVGPHAVARITHIGDRLAGTLMELAAAALAAGTLVAFALTRRPGGLFNFQERGLQPAPQAVIALVAEVGVLVVVGVWLVADHAVHHDARTGVVARV